MKFAFASSTHNLRALLTVALFVAPFTASGDADTPVAASAAGGARAGFTAGERPLADELDLERLMKEVAAMRGLRAHFREEKRIALLSAPLVSTGWLYVVPPDRVLLRTEEPAPARLEIQGDRLLVEDELGREVIDLASQPQARHFVDHMLLMFTGDLALMRERYSLEFQASGDDWTLHLEPRDLLMRRIVSKIALTGVGPAFTEMIVAEPDGDATITRFDQVEADRSFAADEIAAIFEGTRPPAGQAPQ